MVTKAPATIDDLYNAPDDGKYELVDGRLVRMSPTGGRPGHISLRIASALLAYQDATNSGNAFGDNVGFIVSTPRERSFSPDAAYAHTPAINDNFVEDAPVFAVEVRSKNDYGPRMDAEYAAKRADYFAAGTQVVWDVNPRARVIDSYHADDPDTPRRFTSNDIADAEPALPGWRVSVADFFRS